MKIVFFNMQIQNHFKNTTEIIYLSSKRKNICK